MIAEVHGKKTSFQKEGALLDSQLRVTEDLDQSVSTRWWYGHLTAVGQGASDGGDAEKASADHSVEIQAGAGLTERRKIY